MDGPVKVQKQGRAKNIERLSRYRKIVIQKDWKTTLHLLHSQTTEAE